MASCSTMLRGQTLGPKRPQNSMYSRNHFGCEVRCFVAVSTEGIQARHVIYANPCICIAP